MCLKLIMTQMKLSCNFVDKYITGSLPENNTRNHRDIRLMQNLQKHVHSDYCRRNKSCWFGFPKPPTPHTVISCPPPDEQQSKEKIKNAKLILQKVQEHLMSRHIDTEDISLEDVLQSLHLDINTYIEALKVSQ